MIDLKAKSGMAIVFVLAAISVMILIAASLMIITAGEAIKAGTSADNMRAFYLANAGIAKKFMELRSGNMNSITGETFTLVSGRSGTFSVSVTQTQLPPLAVYRLDSTGRYGHASKRITLDVKQVSIAMFSYFSNSENQLFWHSRNPIWFVTNDHLRGPFYTNDQLNISGDPIFDGPVSSVAATINYYHGGPPDDNPVFKESLTLGTPTVTFPASTSIINDIRTASQSSNGLYLTGDTNVVLMPDGTLRVTNSQRRWNNQQVALPVNHALFVDSGDVNVSGILNGQLTVGTSGNIYVVNNILYNTDPLVSSSNDMLGLVSQHNVIVSASAPYDLAIDAYIIALNDSFTVENYSSGLKGTLTIYGGVTQAIRGAIGTFSSTTNQKVSGYTKDYYYDQRLMNSAPFYFPLATDTNGRVLYRKVVWAEY